MYEPSSPAVNSMILLICIAVVFGGAFFFVKAVF